MQDGLNLHYFHYFKQAVMGANLRVTMVKLIDSIYLSSPAWMQNIAISLYGFRQKAVRFRQVLPPEYADIGHGLELSKEEIKKRQNIRLAALISHSAKYVPHYSDLLSRSKIPADQINLDNFEDVFPILDKTEIIANPTHFHSTALSEQLKLFTSGTSGSPMPIVCSREARAINYAFFRKILNSNGCSLDDRSVTFAGRVLFSNKEKTTFWRKDWSNNTLYCSSYYIADDSARAYIRAIEKWNPKYIDSYPSASYEIAHFINKNAIKHSIRPKFVLTSSETLLEYQRREIETAFGCPVIDQYGCTEMAVMAWQENQRYKFEPMYSLVELLPQDGTENYAVICTGLLNFGMPLIRYRIGDLVSGGSFDPEWKYQTPTFESVCGREDDTIITPEGRRIGRMDPVFKGVNGVAKAQIIQHDDLTLEVLIIKDTSQSDAAFDPNLLTRNIRHRTSPLMLVRIKFVDSIPLTRAGKFKSVVSLVERQKVRTQR